MPFAFDAFLWLSSANYLFIDLTAQRANYGLKGIFPTAHSAAIPPQQGAPLWAPVNIFGVFMKTFALACLTLALTIFLGTSAWATGRLNFMLINDTGQDIVDAKIYPTYFPKYESENLLKTALDTDSRIYIGPNYYGEQKFWTIALKWADGHEQIFPKLRLTRYNTYTVYSTDNGIKIRQSYEPDAARYEFGPDAPSYMGAEPDVVVKATAPEKLPNPPARSAKMAVPDNKLAFADTDDTANALALKTTVQTMRDGQTTNISPNGDFKAGDKVRLVFSANNDGRIYWIKKNSDAQYEILFPTAQSMDNAVVRNKEYTVPALEPLQLGNDKGTETIFALLAPKAVPDLDKAIKLEANGDKTAASKLIADVVKKHGESKAKIEEEDDEDVNMQTQQLADGETVFVGNYDLSHE